jgi:hypothetical protein
MVHFPINSNHNGVHLCTTLSFQFAGHVDSQRTLGIYYAENKFYIWHHYEKLKLHYCGENPLWYNVTIAP